MLKRAAFFLISLFIIAIVVNTPTQFIDAIPLGDACCCLPNPCACSPTDSCDITEKARNAVMYEPISCSDVTLSLVKLVLQHPVQSPTVSLVVKTTFNDIDMRDLHGTSVTLVPLEHPPKHSLYHS